MTRKFATVDFEVIEKHRRQLDMPKGKFCEALGYSNTAYSGWKAANKAPLTAAIAAECLIRRQRGRVPTTGTVGAVITVNADHFETIDNVIKSFGGRVARLDLGS